MQQACLFLPTAFAIVARSGSRLSALRLHRSGSSLYSQVGDNLLPFRYPKSARTMATQLEDLPDIERLSPVCIRILGDNPSKFTLQGTNTYLLGSGSKRILLDTGEGKPAWAASIKSVLEQEQATIETVLISHWHHDHTGGIPDIQAIAPSAKVFKHEPEAQQHDIADGQVFKTDGVTLTASHTPGHTVDHMVFVLEEEDAMFTADNVLGQGTAVFEDMGTYLKSLAKMKQLFRGRAYPGHGPVIADGPSKIVEYIEHRRQREEQVVRTLRDGQQSGKKGMEAMEMTKIIYHDVPENLHIPACGGVLQILSKLEQEGKVTTDDDGKWHLQDRSTL